TAGDQQARLQGESRPGALTGRPRRGGGFLHGFAVPILFRPVLLEGGGGRRRAGAAGGRHAVRAGDELTARLTGPGAPGTPHSTVGRAGDRSDRRGPARGALQPRGRGRLRRGGGAARPEGPGLPAGDGEVRPGAVTATRRERTAGRCDDPILFRRTDVGRRRRGASRGGSGRGTAGGRAPLRDADVCVRPGPHPGPGFPAAGAPAPGGRGLLLVEGQRRARSVRLPGRLRAGGGRGL